MHHCHYSVVLVWDFFFSFLWCSSTGEWWLTFVYLHVCLWCYLESKELDPVREILANCSSTIMQKTVDVFSPIWVTYISIKPGALVHLIVQLAIMQSKNVSTRIKWKCFKFLHDSLLIGNLILSQFLLLWLRVARSEESRTNCVSNSCIFSTDEYVVVLQFMLNIMVLLRSKNYWSKWVTYWYM